MLKKRQNRQMTNSLNSSLKQELSLEHLWPLNRKLKTKMRPFPAPQLRTLIEKRWKGSCINLISHYQQISESFRNLVERRCHIWESISWLLILQICPYYLWLKWLQKEKVLSMYGQWYEEEPSKVQEEYDPKVHGESTEKKLQSTINSVREQSALLLIAVRGLYCQQEVSSKNSQKIWYTKK